jgi:hypothetical protein
MNSAVYRSTAPRFSAMAVASLAHSEDGSGLTAVLFQRQLSAFESEVLAVGFGSAAPVRELRMQSFGSDLVADVGRHT